MSAPDEALTGTMISGTPTPNGITSAGESGPRSHRGMSNCDVPVRSPQKHWLGSNLAVTISSDHNVSTSVPVFTTVVNGDELVLTPASAAPARVGGVSRNAGTEPWSPEDWRAFFHERAGIAEYDGGLSRLEAEDHAFACSVNEWLNRNPVTSPPGRCLASGDREHGYDPLLPYGVEPTRHAWLHSRCWEAWHAARKREAAAALKAMGVGKPTCNEMKDGPGHGEGGPKKICDQPPNAYGP
jgi:hypothetical protein